MENLEAAKAHMGKYSNSNCWGLTAYLLGWRGSLTYMTEALMEQRLGERMRQVKKPKRFRLGDVAARRTTTELHHTAVYIGRGQWFHQDGYQGRVEVITLRKVVRSYEGRTLYYRRKAS